MACYHSGLHVAGYMQTWTGPGHGRSQARRLEDVWEQPRFRVFRLAYTSLCLPLIRAG